MSLTTTQLTILKYLARKERTLTEINRYMMRSHSTYPSAVIKAIRKLEMDRLVRFDDGGITVDQILVQLATYKPGQAVTVPRCVYQITDPGIIALKPSLKKAKKS